MMWAASLRGGDAVPAADGSDDMGQHQAPSSACASTSGQDASKWCLAQLRRYLEGKGSQGIPCTLPMTSVLGQHALLVHIFLLLHCTCRPQLGRAVVVHQSTGDQEPDQRRTPAAPLLSRSRAHGA